MNRSILLLLVAFAPIGCAKTPTPVSRPAMAGLASPMARPDLHAVVRPPDGWLPQPIETGSNFTQQVWVSPAGGTAYGVIRFSLPFPVAHELVLYGFLKQMREHEGAAELVEKKWDDNKKCLRFVAAGGKYTVRTNLSVRGWSGWAVFAGTRKDQPVNAVDLPVAELAREETLIDQ